MQTTTNSKAVIDDAITKLQAINNCSIENADIHDHYDCRTDLQTVVANLSDLLTLTEA
mgnify:CR=1 FL=1